MSAVLASLVLPLGQVFDPGFRSPLIKGLLCAVLAFSGVAALAAWGAGALAGGGGWLATAAGALGGVLVLVAAVWLFVPAALATSGLFLDETAAAVERRHYPALPIPACGASLAAQARFNLGLALRVLGLNLLVLPLALVLPLVGAVALWAVAAVALGHGLFEGVAQRRMPVAEARALRRRRRGGVYAVGGVLAAFAAVPVLNLFVPVLGTAAMTHLLHRGSAAAAAVEGPAQAVSGRLIVAPGRARAA